MDCALTEKKCTPCEGSVKALHGEALAEFQSELGRGWTLVEGLRLEREFKFKNFREALDFTNAVGDLAEAEGHHPDIYLAWGKVRITLWTHAAKGLTENDFILAAKIDGL